MYQGKTPQMCTERDSVTSTKKNLEDLVKLILKNLNICFIMKKNVSFSFGNLSRKVEFKNVLDAYTFFLSHYHKSPFARRYRLPFWDITFLFVGQFLILIYQNVCHAKCCNFSALTEAKSDFSAQKGQTTKSDSVTNKT